VTATDRSGVQSVAAISSFISGPRYMHWHGAAMLHANHNKAPASKVSACAIGIAVCAAPSARPPPFSATHLSTLRPQKS
jgi:hypothetical protein